MRARVMDMDGRPVSGDEGAEPVWGDDQFRAAAGYFSDRVRFEIDCYAVWMRTRAGRPPLLVDVRTPRAFAAGHLPSALSLPIERFGEPAISSLPPGVTIVYDSGRGRTLAHAAALALVRSGRRALVMSGGYDGWLEEGFEVEREAVPLGRHVAL